MYESGAFDRLDMAISNTAGIVNELTYASYRHNRIISPEIQPRQWGNIFVDWEALEDRFLQEGQA